MTIRVIIADDEPLAREGIASFLRSESDVEVVAECADGRDALDAITRHRPDLALLDVQMPELDGFGVVAALDAKTRPVVIFVTAYDEYAIRAFEVHAIDYLLKPVERVRFHSALERARWQLRQRDRAGVDERIAALLDELRGRSRYQERFLIKAGGRVTFVRAEEIDWIEAAGNYAKLHVSADRHLLRTTMTALEQQLDPERFVRIHRSTIVNLDRIKEIQPWVKGEHVVVLADGTKLSLSRGYRASLEQRLGDTL